MSNSLKKIFLEDFHKNLSAKFIPFAGYSMPINYTKGIIKEHLHTRKYAGIFDVSHMGQILIPNTSYNCKELEKIIPFDLFNLKLNKSAYSFILNLKGGIIDDIIISKINFNSFEYFFIVYNASRKHHDEIIFIKNTKNSIILNNHCLLAIQGPLSSQVISNFLKSINKMYFMQICTFNYSNHTIIISRTGYTGEDGFELSIPNTIIKDFINDLIKYTNVLFCGLGCRDTLRLEAGLSLYGNELNEDITPVEANLLWAIPKSRLAAGGFNGYETILHQSKKGIFKKKIGIKTINKSILRSNLKIFNKNYKNIGKTTSGGFSPTLNTSIAMAYIDKFFLKNKERLFCLIRDKMEEVELTNLPFVKHNYRRRQI